MNQMDHERHKHEEMVVLDDTELELRAEIERLKQKVEEQGRLLSHSQTHPRASKGVSKTSLWVLAAFALVLIVVGFIAGYLPHQRREHMLIAEAGADAHALPSVNVVPVERSSSRSELILPGNIEAVTEAPLLARASGYVKSRYADIGDRVKAGQLLAEIEAPELDQQVKQAKASLDQASSSLEQAAANLQQGQANEQIAQTTARRWTSLQGRGVVSRQENDTYQAQWEAQKASVHALEKAVAAARSNVGASEANLSRLQEMQGYKKVIAPFAGVITLRNVDVGTLITEGSTLLFRIAQTDRLRTYVNVPQAEAGAVHVGQPAFLTVADRPQRKFTGTVTRTANSLDPSTRTLLTEVQVPNGDGALMPGMYADVDLATPRQDPPLLIPGDTLVVRSDGTQVALVTANKTVHFQSIQLGRDYGDKVEVLQGLEAGQDVIVNPGDAIRENAKVNPVVLNLAPRGPATRRPTRSPK
jgi:RND family efflux transporter MFP subunit